MAQSSKLNELLIIMERLRDPETGCPWDKKQTFSSVAPHTLEEVYELVDALEQKDYSDLKGELGDLLFQVVFYAQIAKEQGLFEFTDILETLNEKLVRRHPHVFSETSFENELAVHANWEKEKQKERLLKAEKMHQPESILDNIPLALPALNRASKIQKRCANVGFDWAELEPVVAKIHEEIDEVLVEVKRTDLSEEQKQVRIEDELGDLLFANVNLVRHLNANPETVLRQANKKFERRFRMVEQALVKQGKKMEECSLEVLDKIWNEVKHS